jgi:hypothetical protein
MQAYKFIKSENISNGERPKEFITREEVWTNLYRLFFNNNKFKKNEIIENNNYVSNWAID